MKALLLLLHMGTLTLAWTSPPLSLVTDPKVVRPAKLNHSVLHMAPPPRPTEGDDGASPVRVLGICGGIGSGKSTVCQALVSDFGCLGHIGVCLLEVLCVCGPLSGNFFGLDHVANWYFLSLQKRITWHTKCTHPIVGSEGTCGRLWFSIAARGWKPQSKRIGKVVFDNAEALRKLESIVWPHVQDLVQSRVQELKNSMTRTARLCPFIIVEAAVMLDAGWHDFQDGLWVVKVSPEVALSRLQEHRRMSHEEARQRIEAQTSRRGIGNLQEEIDKGLVSAVVDNSGDADDLKRTLGDMLNDQDAWYPQ